MIEILQNLCTVRTFTVDLGSTETPLLQHFAELLGGADQREEHNGFAVPAVFHHLIGDLLEIRLQRTADVICSVITLGHSNAANVQLQRNHLCLDRTQVFVLDGLPHGVLKSKAVEVFAHLLFQQLIRCGGYTQHICAGKMTEHMLIAVGKTVMGLVHHDGGEIVRRELRQATFTAQRLHRADCDREHTAKAAALRFFDGAFEAGDHAELIRGLGQQLAAMCHDENSAAFLNSALGNFGHHDRLATARGENKQCALLALRPLTTDGSHGFTLVRPELHTRVSQDICCWLYCGWDGICCAVPFATACSASRTQSCCMACGS